jgi:hypothetical protein
MHFMEKAGYTRLPDDGAVTCPAGCEHTVEELVAFARQHISGEKCSCEGCDSPATWYSPMDGVEVDTAEGAVWVDQSML